jgi:hypothetical protein
MVTMSIDVENTGDIVADTVTFMLWDPSFNSYNVDVPAAIGVGETQGVAFDFQTDATMEAGIWNILYFLYSGEEEVSYDYGGKFALEYDMDVLSQFQAYITVTRPVEALHWIQLRLSKYRPAKNRQCRSNCRYLL